MSSETLKKPKKVVVKKKGRKIFGQKFKKKPSRSHKENLEIEALKAKYEELDSAKIKTFQDIPLSQHTRKGLKDSGFKVPTEIQRESLVLSLKNHDILGAAKTGSGKTLAFIIPLLEKLFCLKWTSLDGIGALVITPTRELAYQIFEQLRQVGRYHEFSAGLVIGGKDLAFESKRMAGCNIVICTPGRLLQHMDENPQFDASGLQMLILDEADRCLEMGFAEQMNAILDNLPKERQTLLFSATQTRNVKDLARLSLDKPVYVSVHEHASKLTPDELSENYIVCDLDQKLDMLWSFLRNHSKKKILVFVQSCHQARFYCDILSRLRVPMPHSALHGKLKQMNRMKVYNNFCQQKIGVLIATDIAARGLDFPTVDWVLQLDCPEDWKTYNHRVGRTARNKRAGQALLVLMPSEEEAMVKHLKLHKFEMDKIEVDPKKLMSVQKKVAAQLVGDSELKDKAQRAFQAYLKSVFLMKDKSIFNASALDTDKFAKSLGMEIAPRVRFLRKHQQRLEKEKESQEKPEEDQIKADSSDDDDDGFLSVKRANHELSEEDEDELEPLEGRKSKKAKSKAALAKKLLKKNLSLNQKVKFDEEGDAFEDLASNKVSDIGKLYEKEDDGKSGIDINKAKEILQAEDMFDRKKEKERIRELHKEKKRKEKEAKRKRQKPSKDDEEASEVSDSEEEVDLSWLPDPDTVYGLKEHDSETSSDESHKGQKKRKAEPPSNKDKSRKKARKIEEEEEVLDNRDLEDDEMLALKLLGK